MTPETLENKNEFTQSSETSAEKHENELTKGAELLENPPDDSFMQGLQSFITWVKTLLASGDHK